LAVFVLSLIYTPTVLRSADDSVKDEYEKEVAAALQVKDRRENASWKLVFHGLSEDKAEASVTMEAGYTVVNNGNSASDFDFTFEFDTSAKFALQHQPKGGVNTVFKGEVSFFRQAIPQRPVQHVDFKPENGGSTKYKLASRVPPFRLLVGEKVEVAFRLTTPIGVTMPYADFWLHRRPVTGLTAVIDYGGFPLRTEVLLLRGNQEGVIATETPARLFNYRVEGAFLAYQGLHLTVRHNQD
jgi:hypothetical protein